MNPTIIFARHGQTAYNASSAHAGGERFRGWLDLPLSEHGIDSARQTAASLAGEPITLIYYSPMHRSFQTAQAIAQATGGVPLMDGALMDWNVGALSGQPMTDETRALVRHYQQTVPYEAIPGGEPFLAFLVRCLSGVTQMMKQAVEQAVFDMEIAAVTHSRVLRTIDAWLSAGGRGLYLDPEIMDEAKHFVDPAEIMPVAQINGIWTVLRGENGRRIGKKGAATWTG